jgi:hypothetical protein
VNALERAERDCRLRAAMLLLEPELPEQLADLLVDAIVARVRGRAFAEGEPAAVRSAYYRLGASAGVRARLREEAARNSGP